MPLMPDTRIYGDDGSGQSARPMNPLQTLGAMMQIKEQQQALQLRELQRQKEQRDNEDDFAGRNALQIYADDPVKAIDSLFRDGRSNVGAKVAQDYYGAQHARLTRDNAALKQKSDTLTFAGQTLGPVNDNPSYQAWRKNYLPAIQQTFGEGVSQLLPEEYGDGTQVKQVLQASMSRAEQIQQQAKDAQDWIELYKMGTEWDKVAPHVFPEQDAQERAKAAADPTYKPWSGMQQISPSGQVAMQAQRSIIGNHLFQAQSLKDYNDILEREKGWVANPAVLQEFALPNYDPNLSPEDQAKALEAAKEKAVRQGLTLEQNVTMDEKRASEERLRKSSEAIEANRARQYNRQMELDAANIKLRQAELGRRDENDEWRRTHPTGGITPYQEEVTIPTKLKAAWDKSDEWVTKNTIAGTQGYAALREAALRGLAPPTPGQKPAERQADMQAGQQAVKYITEQMRIEDINRATQGRRPILETAKKAVQDGDRAGYQKLEQDFHTLTNGVGELSDIVPWESKTGAAKKAELIQIAQKLGDPKTTPAEKAQLNRRLLQLRTQPGP